MDFTPYGYQNPYYPQPMPDTLMQMRQQQMPMMQTPQAPQNPIAQGGVQWVSGEQEARNWMIAPNAAVALWDSTAPTVYLKQADASGRPTLKIYDLVERAETPRTAPQEKVCIAAESPFKKCSVTVTLVPLSRLSTRPLRHIVFKSRSSSALISSFSFRIIVFI